MNKRAKVLTAAAVALAVGLIVWAVATVPDAPVVKENPEQKTMTYDGNTISEEKNGRKIWELTADHMEVDVKTQDMSMEGITGHFYAENGTITDLKADKVVYGGKSKDVKLTGNIKVTSSDGAILTSKELEWLNQKEILSAIGDVRAVREDVFLTADRVDSSDGFNKVKATGHAHVERNEDKAKKMAKEMAKEQPKEQAGGKADE